MASKLKVDQIEGQSGTSVEVPTGHTLKVADLGNNKILSTNSSGVVTATAMGSTDQVLKMTGSNTLGFGTISSDFVKIAEVSPSGGEIAFNSIASTDYKYYQLEMSQIGCASSGNDLYLRFRQGTSNKTANNYYSTYLNSYHNGSNGGVNSNGDQATYIRIANWNQPNSGTYGSNWTFRFGNITQDYPKVDVSGAILDANMANIITFKSAGIYNMASQNIDGFTIYWSGGANFKSQGLATLYGLK